MSASRRAVTEALRRYLQVNRIGRAEVIRHPVGCELVIRPQVAAGGARGDGLAALPNGCWQRPWPRVPAGRAQGAVRTLAVVVARDVGEFPSAAPRPARGSETVRSRSREPVASLRLTALFGRQAPARFGIGSVARRGSVGPVETRTRSSTYSRRTGLSVGLKIRVSVVRFRPWPPLLQARTHVRATCCTMSAGVLRESLANGSFLVVERVRSAQNRTCSRGDWHYFTNSTSGGKSAGTGAGACCGGSGEADVPSASRCILGPWTGV